MKNNKLVALLLLAVFILSTCACGFRKDQSNPSDNGGKDDISRSEFKIVELDVDEDDEVVSKLYDHYVGAPKTDSAKSKYGIEIELKDCYTTSRIKAQNSTPPYSFYDSEEGKKFVVCSGSFKNNADYGLYYNGGYYLSSQPFVALMCLNGSEFHLGNAAFSNVGDTSLESKVDAGTDIMIYFYCIVPEDMEVNKVECYLGFGDFLVDVMVFGLDGGFFDTNIDAELKKEFTSVGAV